MNKDLIMMLYQYQNKIQAWFAGQYFNFKIFTL